jgi:hypothetical protein
VKGNEPLFGWLRLVVPSWGGQSGADRVGFALKAHLPRRVPAVPEGALPTEGWRLTDESGKVLLGIPGGQKARFSFTADEKDFTLFIRPDVIGADAGVDVVFPALAADPTAYDEELKCGYNEVLKETNVYWSKVPETSACVDTPEPFVNRAISQGLKFTEIITTRGPAADDYCMLTGSLEYQGTYSAPDCMRRVWLLDMMGYYSVDEK